MPISALVTVAGMRILPALAAVPEADLSVFALAADRRLRRLVGTTNYALLLAQSETLTAFQHQAATQAGRFLGAAELYESGQFPITQQGVVVSTETGDLRRSHASPEAVKQIAARMVNRAIQELDREGLYQRPEVAVPRAIEVADE